MSEDDMIKLDTKRPYGSVHGEEEASWEQDGMLFRADGTVLEHRLTDAQKAEVAKRAKREAATKRARDELKRKLVDDDGLEPEEAEAAIDEAEATPDAAETAAAPAGGIDLVAWGRDELKPAPAWLSIVKAFKEQHGFAVTSKESAKQFLRDEGLI